MPWVTFCHCMEVWRQPAGTASASVRPCLPTWCWAVSRAWFLQFLCFHWHGQIESTAAGGWVVCNGLACLHFAFATAVGSSVCCCVNHHGNWRWVWKLISASWYCYEWVWPAVTTEYVSPYWGPAMVLFSWSFIQKAGFFFLPPFPSLFLPSFHLLESLITFSCSFFFSLLLLSFTSIICCWFQVQAGWYPGSMEDKRTPKNSPCCCSSSHGSPASPLSSFHL